MSLAKLVVGLGNSGPGYEWTRHNLGFMVVTYLAASGHMSFRRSRHCRGLMAKGEMAHKRCGLLKPLTFMNNSGQAVKDILDLEDLALENVLVVCDDYHLAFGEIRLRLKGSAGGHQGLISIIQEVGADAFSRLRVGIGAPRPGQDPADPGHPGLVCYY